jgi:peptidoglycan/xylan/chitin deacetylase (PgdA/CDA1 family)
MTVLTAAASAGAALAAPAVRPAGRVHDLLPAAPRHAVALTIDDGPDPVWTPQVLDLLRRTGIRATFCPLGKHVRAYPGLMRRIIAEGHNVANHTMTHPQPFGNRPLAEMRQELTDAQSAITDVAGVTPKSFRAPCGDWSAPVLSVAHSLELALLGWSIDPVDWSRPGTRLIVTRLLEARPGDILLCHDGGGDRFQTLESLRIVLPALKDRGLQFVAL